MNSFVESPSAQPASSAADRPLEQAWELNEKLGLELAAGKLPPSETARALEDFTRRRRILYVHLQARLARRQRAARS